jgi:hypothetical protein
MRILKGKKINNDKSPQSAANDVKAVKYRQLHYVRILTSHVLVESHTFCMMLNLQLRFYHTLCY